MNSELSGQAIKILLVEDNPGDARLTFEALREAKVRNEVMLVTDGEQAMDFLHRQGRFADAPKPDLILLDLNLPKKDGRAVLAEIKGHEMLRRIPVVILTTSQAEKDVFASYDLHANCYISKPVALDEFMDVVRRIESFWLTIVCLPSE
jgi:two-component system, chemotaxis family, response regulator Rcp1